MVEKAIFKLNLRSRVDAHWFDKEKVIPAMAKGKKKKKAQEGESKEQQEWRE